MLVYAGLKEHPNLVNVFIRQYECDISGNPDGEKLKWFEEGCYGEMYVVNAQGEKTSTLWKANVQYSCSAEEKGYLAVRFWDIVEPVFLGHISTDSIAELTALEGTLSNCEC